MKKFLMALVLVLCLAFPAMAQEHKSVTVTDNDGMTNARTSFDNGEIDTIVVSGEVSLDKKQSYTDAGAANSCGLYVPSGKTLKLHINNGCKLTVEGNGNFSCVENKGTLTITGSGSIVCNSPGVASGILASGGTVTIQDAVTIDTKTANGDASGINVYGGTIIVKDNVKINATLKSSSDSWGSALGIKVTDGTVTVNDNVTINATYNGTHSDTEGAYGVWAEQDLYGATTATATILNGVISGDFNCGNGGTIAIYGGKFSADPNSYLGTDCAKESISETPYNWKVTSHAKETFNPVSLSLDITNGAASNSVDVTLVASDDASKKCTSFDILDVVPAKDGVTASVDKSTGKITFTAPANCTPDNYEFTVTCYGKCSDDKYRLQTKMFTVNVTKTTETPQLVFGSNPVSIAKGSNLDVPVSIKYGTQTLSADITNVSAPAGITVTSKDSAINIAVAADCASGDHTVTVTATSGAHTASADLKVTVTDTPTPTPTPTPVDNLPGTPKFNEEENVVQGKAATYTDKSTAVAEMKNDLDENAFDEKELAVDSNGKAKVSEETAAKAINNTSGGKATSGDIISFPIVKVTTDSTSDDLTLLATFIVSGDQLTYAKTPDKIRVYKIFDGEHSERVTYVKETRDAGNRNFTVLDKDGNPATEIKSGENYYISIYVADNDTYDLDDGTVGQIIDPIAIDTSATTSGSGGSSGGCNAGFGTLALAALAVIAAKRRKK